VLLTPSAIHFLLFSESYPECRCGLFGVFLDCFEVSRLYNDLNGWQVRVIRLLAIVCLGEAVRRRALHRLLTIAVYCGALAATMRRVVTFVHFVTKPSVRTNEV